MGCAGEVGGQEAGFAQRGVISGSTHLVLAPFQLSFAPCQDEVLPVIRHLVFEA